MRWCRIVLMPLLFACHGPGTEQVADPGRIKLNQVGFYPGERKLAVVPASAEGSFNVTSVDGATVYFSSRTGPVQRWPFSAEEVRIADFSAFERPGRYRLVAAGGGSSYPFEVAPGVLAPVAAAALKAYYFNRSAMALEPRYAGRWVRAAGHPDDEVRVHPSAASAGRRAGDVISSPGGWYDAGDYNKYVVNSGISTFTLVAAYEHFPEAFRHLEVNIPESGDSVPDVIDEALVNLRWMLTMQDPHDGGVYHKLTTRRFAGMVMPDQATEPRWVVQKNTAATLDFAATMAAAGRVVSEWPQHASTAEAFRKAAMAAWQWAQCNPDVLYEQPADVVTGPYVYEHEDLRDELVWAATELFLLTGDPSYVADVDIGADPGGVPSWDYVSPLAWISLSHADRLPPGVSAGIVRERIIAVADRLCEQADTSAYRVAMGAFPERYMMGASERDFSWGSNGVASYQGVVLLAAYRLSSDRTYLESALSNLDYVLGRNPTGYSFVTGFGTRSPQNVLHRPSVADGVPDPVPGWVVGGPHDGLDDARECSGLYPSTLPALAYVDDVCSYATNEVAINWNAPLVYVSGALDHLLSSERPSSRVDPP